MSNYDPPQQPWGGPPQDPYGGAPQYPPPQNPGGFPPPTSAFPPGGGYQPPVSGAGGFPPPPGGGYPPPADPYGAGGGFQDPYAQQQQGFGQQPGGYGGYQPPAPARGGGGTKIVLIIAGIVLLALCGGGIFTAYTLTKDDDKDPVADPTATSTASPSGGASTTGRPTSTATNTRSATPTSGGSNPDTFVKGDCFVNEGTENDPEVRKVACTTANAYEVVAKVPGSTDENRCDTVAGSGKWNASYVMDKSPGNSGDYVLCLKKR